MDLRITKERFNEHWTYDWVKYILFVLVAIAIVSLLFAVTARRLTDAEELKIIVYSKHNGYLQSFKTKDDLRDYILSQNLSESEYLDNDVCYYAYGNDIEEKQAAQGKFDADESMGIIDVVVLPVLPKYFDDDGNLLEYMRKFEYYAGVGKFIPLDEAIESEVAKNNPAAIELKQTLAEHPEYYYKCAMITPNKDENGEHVHDSEIRNFGINLNALDLSKVNTLVYEDDLVTGLEPSNYALGVIKDSESHAEAICFINWFIKNYA